MFVTNLVKHFRLKSLCIAKARFLNTETMKTKPEWNINHLSKCADQLEVEETWPLSEVEGLAAICRDFTLIPNFISDKEEKQLMEELEPYLKKMRYEYDHWDDAIHGYKETEKHKWNKENEQVFKRVKQIAFGDESQSGKPQPFVHVLDLAEKGYIKPHVDATRYCGEVIAGISLLSDSVMRLVSTKDESRCLRAVLSRRSLYVMRGVARYDFSHAVLPQEQSILKGKAVHRERRVALIMRSQPPPAND